MSQEILFQLWLLNSPDRTWSMMGFHSTWKQAYDSLEFLYNWYDYKIVMVKCDSAGERNG